MEIYSNLFLTQRDLKDKKEKSHKLTHTHTLLVPSKKPLKFIQNIKKKKICKLMDSIFLKILSLIINNIKQYLFVLKC